MRAPQKRPQCPRVLTDKEQYVVTAKFGTDELAILAIARYYFQTFAVPASQAWIPATDLARHAFGALKGPRVAAAVLDMLREMRISRRSTFQFSNPECQVCADVLTENERQLMGVFRGLRNSMQSEAYVNALLLCEGNEINPLLGAAGVLVNALSERIEATDGPKEQLFQPVEG